MGSVDISTPAESPGRIGAAIGVRITAVPSRRSKYAGLHGAFYIDRE